MSIIDVRGTIREILEDGYTDKGIISSLTMARIPEERSREAAQEMVFAYVTSVINSLRTGPPPIQEPSVSVSSTAATACSPRSGRKSIKSSAAQMGAWERFLGSLYEGADKTKQVRDFTAEDCRAAAKMRWELVQSNSINAQRFEDYAKLIEDYRVDTLGELPPVAWGTPVDG